MRTAKRHTCALCSGGYDAQFVTFIKHAARQAQRTETIDEFRAWLRNLARGVEQERTIAKIEGGDEHDR